MEDCCGDSNLFRAKTKHTKKKYTCLNTLSKYPLNSSRIERREILFNFEIRFSGGEKARKQNLRELTNDINVREPFNDTSKEYLREFDSRVNFE